LAQDKTMSNKISITLISKTSIDQEKFKNFNDPEKYK